LNISYKEEEINHGYILGNDITGEEEYF